MRGKVKQEIVEECELFDFDEKDIWEVIRGYLKKMGLKRYYNRIPSIIWRMGYDVLDGYSWTKYLSILDDFEKMHKKFVKGAGLVYFPNLRFICFKLMEKYGIRYRFYVPMIRTFRKRARLDELCEELLME